MTMNAQASPDFSVLLCVLGVELLHFLKRERLSTQRTQRSTEKNEPEKSR
jgi:hypothetical protein